MMQNRSSSISEKKDEKQRTSLEKRSSVSCEEEQRPGSQEAEITAQDNGGGGDTQDVDKSIAEQPSTEGSISEAEQDIENSYNESALTNETRNYEQPDRYSAQEIATAREIVAQILENLLDAVLSEIEVKSRQSNEESIWEEKNDQNRVLNIEEQDIKSASDEIKDDQLNTASDDELQAKLALEQENAYLKQYEINTANYLALTATRAQLKQKNNFLLKQMYELYKTEKTEHLFRELPVSTVDLEGKYMKLLLAYEQVKCEAEEEEVKLQKQVYILYEKKNTINSNLEEEFNSLLEKERSIGRDLIFSQTSKLIPEKTIEKLISRQIAKSKEVSKQRFTYFKLRDAVTADESLLKSLQTLGENLTLMEYEQLKMQSQSCVEKLEERDADLHRLRSKATSAIQVLAEIREKAQALLDEIEAGKVTLHDVNHQLGQTRERLGCEKQRRDMIRSDAVRLRHEAGLLSEPKLLKDYNESTAEKGQLSMSLAELKHNFEQQKQTIASLRKSIADQTKRNN